MKIFLRVMGMVLLLGHWYCNAQIPREKTLIIVIDPGHGGRDSGAVGVKGVMEKDVVLKAARNLIKGQCKFDGREAHFYLTRYSDTLISLGDRCRLAKSLNADLFISLHCNDSPDSTANGVEVYVCNQENPFLKQSIWISYLLEKKIAEHTNQISRGVKFANFQVLRDLKFECPAILIELGFLSNVNGPDYLNIFEALLEKSLLD